MTGNPGCREVVGMLAYMSPDQAAGSVGEIDVRVDVYALEVSETTAKTDWRIARAWLRRELESD